MKPQVNKIVLQSVITDCENRKTFRSLTALFDEAAKSNYAVKYGFTSHELYDAAVRLGCSVRKTNGGVLEAPKPVPEGGGAARRGFGRVKQEIDKEELQTVIEAVEMGSTTYTTQGELWQAVADTDWAKAFTPPLSPSLIYQRFRQFDLTCKTQPGAKGAANKLEVSKEDFQKIVDEIEAKQTFEKLGDLWDAVAETKWAKEMTPRPLTAAVAYQRAKEFGIVTKTQPARKTRQSQETSVDAEGNVVESRPVMRMAPDYTDRMNMGVTQLSGHRMVSYPSGEAPFHLKGTDAETVGKWAKEVVAYFRKRYEQMLPTALTYFARHYYDVFSEEYKTVVGHIAALRDKDELY